ncbi:MAG: PTS sugar transporter subunit IIA [Planctomycetes bacterium]|nr:PTS sugar transporter subunit IIA [Planctomycetota bacterium]
MASEQRPVHVLALVSAPEMGTAVVRYATVLGEACQARLSILCSPATPSPILPAGAHRVLCLPDAPGALREKAQRFAAEGDVGMIVSDWGRDPQELAATLRMTVGLHLPGVFARHDTAEPPRRLLVPTTGGPHVIKQLWVANELGRAFRVPTQILQIVARHDVQAEEGKGGDALAHVRERLCGVTHPMDVVVADDAVSGIAAYARRDDLIVMGAPNYWRVLHQFEGSIPDLVAKTLPNPLLMLLTPRASHLRLRDIFWEEMLRVDMAPRDRREALAMLADVLAEHGQIPPEWRERVLDRALARESVLATAMDCETALPHVTIPDFDGMMGCFGICPQGVAFGDAEGQLTRFIFLLVTPPSGYGEYLNVLALIARLVLPPERRERLLACRSAAEVSAILAEANP